MTILHSGLLILEQRAASLLGREREMSAGLKDRRRRGRGRGKEGKKERKKENCS